MGGEWSFRHLIVIGGQLKSGLSVRLARRLAFREGTEREKTTASRVQKSSLPPKHELM